MAKKKTTTNPDPTVNLKVFVRLDEAAQALFNHQRGPNVVSFPAIVATVAKMTKSGKLTGATEDDKYVIVLTSEQLTEVFAEAKAYQASLPQRPASVQDSKQAIAYAEQAIAFAKANNSGLDLSQAEAKLSSAKAQLVDAVFKTGSEEKSTTTDFHPVVEMAYDAANTTKVAMVENLKVRAAGLAKETNTLDRFAAILSNLPTDMDNARKELVNFIKKARQLRTPPARTTVPKHSDRLAERVGTSLGHTGGYTGRR